MTDFAIRVDQNKYLPAGSQEVHAIVTVEASGPVERATATEAAEVIIVDTSGSMAYGKIAEARKAAQAAIDTLRDGVYFAVIAGDHQAEVVFPGDGRLAPADPRSREAAKDAVARLRADGGTAMGRWLRRAADLFSAHQVSHPGAIRHAILLTDGKNEHEPAPEFDANLAYCAGKFVCDCRGVGTDWVVAEVRRIGSTLLGSVMDVRRPEELEADFRAMTEAAMGKTVADVALRLWTPRAATLNFVKQVSPSLEDLTGRRTDVDALTGDYPTGSWGGETREYHISVRVPPGNVGQEMRAGLVRLVVPDTGQVLAVGNILAQWSDDPAQSTRINPRVAHYTGQQELASLIQEGLQARNAGDVETATARLGRARGIAQRAGNEETAKLLDKVVEIDPESGTARLKRVVDKADEIALDTRSVRTVRMRKDPEG
ncbi:VWA domain-containing protein [Sphaerisporangium melleum]|uniref:VWA domain-containing protein n=1 Tax=Sphaerisporangium melleum TaxID=321316 RepID=A0A917R4U5_9ACTN|nr:VWA domain-containing protein [Sphaerisporangium melleum]GGK89463.1 VWA domain-containing protein [Sphaerisporangium melleum]GII72503.1 VWA domain-containing protein [Sphaerisporangium melleum]